MLCVPADWRQRNKAKVQRNGPSYRSPLVAPSPLGLPPRSQVITQRLPPYSCLLCPRVRGSLPATSSHSLRALPLRALSPLP
eukprot:7386674-Prymnesium_polylepis.1